MDVAVVGLFNDGWYPGMVDRPGTGHALSHILFPGAIIYLADQSDLDRPARMGTIPGSQLAAWIYSQTGSDPGSDPVRDDRGNSLEGKKSLKSKHCLIPPLNLPFLGKHEMGEAMEQTSQCVREVFNPIPANLNHRLDSFKFLPIDP